MISTERLTSTSDLRFRVESAVCDRHQRLCWTVEVWGHDIAGTGERGCWTFIPHIDSMSRALRLLANVASTSAVKVRVVEEQAWLLEHQLTLNLSVE